MAGGVCRTGGFALCLVITAPTFPISMPHWHTLADELSDLIVRETDEALRDALSKTDDALFDLYGQGGPQAAAHMDALQKLRFVRNSLLEKWPEQVRTYCRNFGNAPVTLGELTLVTDAEMEINLAASTMGEAFGKSQRPYFSAIEQMFERLIERASSGEWEGLRDSAAPSDAPLHPTGLAQMACAWIGEWEGEGESRIVAIKHLERRLIAALPKLLSNGLALLEKHLGSNTAPGSYGNAAASSARTDETGSGILPEDVLPLAEQNGRGWLDTLNDAQEGLYDSPITSLDGATAHRSFTPDFGHLIDQGGVNEPDMPANAPMYLDDLIRARQPRAQTHNPVGEVGAAPPGGLGGVPAFQSHFLGGLDDEIPINMPANMPRGGVMGGEGGVAHQSPPDSRTLAGALINLMGKFGSWLPGGGGGAQAPAPEPSSLPPLQYTGRRGYDPTLDLAQIDEAEFDPTMADLFALIQSRRAASERQRELQGDQARLPRIGPQPLSAALRALQRNPAETVIEAARRAGHGDGGGLAQALKEALVMQSRAAGAPENGELEDADSDAADIVGMLFEIFLSERQISEEMRGRIAKLVAPYVRVAVADRKMFMQKTHPARRYLDTLAAAVDGNQGANYQERQMLDKAGHSIDHLTESFNEDLAIFELAEEEMRQYIDQRKAAIEQAEKRAAEAQRGKERLDQAKALADTAFENAIEECNWPVKTLEMLRGWWCQHHRMALLQDNPQLAVKESENLLSLLVTVGNQGVVAIGTQAVKAHNDIITMLASSGLTGQAAQNGAAELWSALEQASIWTRLAAQGQLSSDDLARTSTKSSREADRAAMAAAETPVAPGFQDLSPDIEDHLGVGRNHDLDDDIPVPDYFSSNQDIVDYFKNMPLGTWVDFVTTDRKLVATKLSWISPISHRLLFVTARGTKHAVESAEDLAMMVKLDRVRLRRVGLGENGFDSSYRKALDVLGQLDSHVSH